MIVFEDTVGLIEQGILTQGELQTLKDFILEECSLRSPTPSAYGTTTPTDVNWLNTVIFEWNDIDNFTGYWRADFMVDDNGNIVDVDAVIVLNVAYLRNLRSLKRAFSHEYGHHWTLSYYAVSQNVNIRRSYHSLTIQGLQID